MKEIDNLMETLKIKYEELEKIILSKSFLNQFSGPYHFKDKKIRKTNFPNAKKHGIFIFYNKHSEIRYIGMAFFENIEKRLIKLIDKKWIGDKNTEYLRTLEIQEELYPLIPVIEFILLKVYESPLNKELK